MELYRYRVGATCNATVHETWVIESRRPLTEDEVAELVQGCADTSDVAMNCIEEQVGNEHDRLVDTVVAL